VPGSVRGWPCPARGLRPFSASSPLAASAAVAAAVPRSLLPRRESRWVRLNRGWQLQGRLHGSSSGRGAAPTTWRAVQSTRTASEATTTTAWKRRARRTRAQTSDGGSDEVQRVSHSHSGAYTSDLVDSNPVVCSPLLFSLSSAFHPDLTRLARLLLRSLAITMSAKAPLAGPPPAAPLLETSNSRLSLSLQVPPPGVCFPGQALHPVVCFKGDTKYEKLSLSLHAETPVRVWGKDRWVSLPLTGPILRNPTSRD
jgi:hypothetical protein